MGLLLPSDQDNSYAKVAHRWVAYSKPLHKKEEARTQNAKSCWKAEGLGDSTHYFILLILEGFTLCNHRQAFSMWEGHGSCPSSGYIGPRSERRVSCSKKTQIRTLGHLYHRSILEPVTEVSGTEVTP